MGLAAALAAGACTPERDAGPVAGSRPDRPGALAAAEPGAPLVTDRELDGARATILARSDSVREAFRGMRGLSREELAQLRRDVNAQQIATARSLGVRAGGDEGIDRLVRRGELVELEDSTRYWVTRELRHSHPYVTPDTRAMLLEIGRRFQARLDSAGLPAYRMEVTSVLRTAESQADLRGVNSNASQGVSAHEFGTTLDVSHVRFTAPLASELRAEVPGSPEETQAFRAVEAAVLAELARLNAQALQAELGRAIAELREEGKLRVMMERRQPVYHMTVARRFPEPDAVEVREEGAGQVALGR